MSYKIYIIGSLRNPRVPEIAQLFSQRAVELGARGEVFDDWYAAGPEADDKWRDYEKARGHGFIEALRGYSAQHVYNFDKKHLDESDVAVMVLPAGRSDHLELGYMLGRGKPGYILLGGEPERYDVMYNFATAVVPDVDALIKKVFG